MPNNFKNGQLEETIATSFVSDKALSPTVVARRGYHHPREYLT
jgi:hypothetical protein